MDEKKFYHAIRQYLHTNDPVFLNIANQESKMQPKVKTILEAIANEIEDMSKKIEQLKMSINSMINK